MYSMTRFSKLINQLPKGSFNRIIKKNKADKYSKSLKTWDILIIMLYGQINQTKSLRRLIEGYNSHKNHHYHLNSKQIRRSTFSDALSNRSVEPFKQMCELLLSQTSKKQRKEGKNLLSIIDSSPISLRGHGFNWTKDNKSNRIQGLKLHIAIDGQNNNPVYMSITHANINDITEAKENIAIEQNITYVFDKGYLDYNWWYQINEAHSHFVTRIKKNTAYQVMSNTIIDKEDSEIIQYDQVIQLTNKKPRAKAINQYAFKDLRLVTVYRDGKMPMQIVTNDFERSAKEIAELYKQRWHVELFFKWIKQKLKLKTYFGRSENAVRIQLYCALIAYLAMAMLKTCNNAWNSMLDVHTWLANGLFVRDDTVKSTYYRLKEQREFIKKVQLELPLFG